MSSKGPRFYVCEKCKAVFEEIQGHQKSLSCCETPLKELVANTSDGAQEKHLPVIHREGNRVEVSIGSVLHPMSAEHSIEWVYLQTKNGCQRVDLKSDMHPKAIFMLADNDQAVAAYAFCNLHGFWKSEISQ